MAAVYDAYNNYLGDDSEIRDAADIPVPLYGAGGQEMEWVKPGDPISDVVVQELLEGTHEGETFYGEGGRMLGPPARGVSPGGMSIVNPAAVAAIPAAVTTWYNTQRTQPGGVFSSVPPGTAVAVRPGAALADQPDGDIMGLLAQIAQLSGIAIAALPPWVRVALVGGAAIAAIVAALRGGAAGSARTSNGGARAGRRASGAVDGSYLLQGPGVPEPMPGTYYKTWRTSYELPGTFLNGYTWFWALNDGRILSYGGNDGRSWVWKPKKPAAVLMRGGKTSLPQAIKAQRILDKMWRNVAKKTKALKLA